MAKMQESELPTSTQMDFKNIMLNSNKKKKEERVCYRGKHTVWFL
jgi:hypothetical protein